MTNHPWFILFDIDGTLLTVDSNFNRLLLRELLDEHRINYPDMEKDAFSGRTDHDIFTSFLVNHDYDETLYHNFKGAYLSALDKRLTPDQVIRHDHVDEAIQYFSQPKFVKGLLTGNYPVAASYKLRAAEIEYEFEVGAFGENDRDRNNLPLNALADVRSRYGIEPDPSKFLIIGDTPRDVICAKNAGMRCVAVSTGKFNEKELDQYGPDLVVPSLKDPDSWFDAFQ